MKLSDYAKQIGERYETAWRWFRDGKSRPARRAAYYHHHLGPRSVSGGAIPSCSHLCARGPRREPRQTGQPGWGGWWPPRPGGASRVVNEVRSGVNDAGPKLLALLADQRIGLIVVEPRDRLTRLGFRYLNTLLPT